MSSTYTNSETNTYSESRARYVMGKIFDDFHAISNRGFDFFDENPDKLQKWREDIYYLMTNEVLQKFQIQFKQTDGEEWAVEFEIRADGSIQRDSESGGIDYWEIPEDVNVGIVASWSRNKKHVEEEMIRRNWTKGATYIGGDLIDDGSYSKSGYGASKGRRGAWKS